MSGGVIAAVVIAVVILALAATLVLCLILYYKHKKLHVQRKGPEYSVTHAEEASTNSSKAAPQQGS